MKAKLSLAPPDSGTYLAHLKERLSAEASGKVAFLGFVPRSELLDLYYNADVFAFAPIWDEGFGIPPELHEKIFDRLYQVDQTTTRAAGGVGLGLYISQRLAETLGGRLWLERSDGDGSVFCLSLPWDQPKRSRDPNAIGTEAAV